MLVGKIDALAFSFVVYLQMIDPKTQDIKAVGRAMRRMAEENESRAAAVVAPDSVSAKDGWKVERPLEE